MKKVIKSIFQYVGAILLAIVIAALLRFFIVDFYSIPSDSMYPTIEPGDFIVVNKMYMGARFYKNFDFLDGAHPETVRVPGFSSLKRNDVIVFNFPTHTNGRWDMDLGTFYVKRCIALPGDTLSIITGINHITAKPAMGTWKSNNACTITAENMPREFTTLFPSITGIAGTSKISAPCTFPPREPRSPLTR